MKRCVIVGFFAVVEASPACTGTSEPVGKATGSSGMGGFGNGGFPSCECKVDVEFEGDGVGGGRCVRVLVWPLILVL